MLVVAFVEMLVADQHPAASGQQQQQHRMSGQPHPWPLQYTEDISALVDELLSSIDQVPACALSSHSRATPARPASARFAASSASAQVARPCSARAQPAARNHLLTPSTAQSPRSACVSRDCSLNARNTGTEQSSGKAEGTARCPCTCAELQTGHAAKWRAHFQQKAGKQSSSCRSLTTSAPSSCPPPGEHPPPISCPPSPSPGGYSSAAAQPAAFKAAHQLPEPQTASASAAPHTTVSHNAPRGQHILRRACRILWLWVLNPAALVFTVFLAVSFLPPSLYTQPASITCLVRGQEQACAAVLDAAVAAAVQEPPGWMRTVLVTKWVLQDYASRLPPLLPPVCQAHAPATAVAAAEPQQRAAAGGGAGTTTALGPHSTDSSSDHCESLASERETAAGHTMAALPAAAAAPAGAAGTTIPHEGRQLTDMVVSGTGAADSQPSSQAAPATGEGPVFVSRPSGTNAPQLGGADSDVQRRAKRVLAGAQRVRPQAGAAGGSVPGRGGRWCRITTLYEEHNLFLCPVAPPGLQINPRTTPGRGAGAGCEEVEAAASPRQEGGGSSRQPARSRRRAQDPIQAAPLLALALVGAGGLAALAMLPRLPG